MQAINAFSSVLVLKPILDASILKRLACTETVETFRVQLHAILTLSVG